MEKRGISAVVAVVMMILLVIVLIAAMWTFVLPYFELEDIERDMSVAISFLDGYTCYDSDSQVSIVQVSRGASDANLSGLKVVFSKGGGSHTFYPEILESNSKRVYWFSISGQIDGVSVAPIFYVGKNKKEGDIISSGKLSPCSLGEIPIDVIYVEDCGDGVCDEGEGCSTCSDDCGSCADQCSDEDWDGWEECGLPEYECAGDMVCSECMCESICDVTLEPGTNVLYDALVASPDSALDGYDQWVICLNEGEYSEKLFGDSSEELLKTKYGLTLLGWSGRAIIDLDGGDAINIRSKFVTLKNLEIKNAVTQGAIAKESDFIFINNIVHDVGRDGVQLNPTENHLVVNNTFYNTPEDAIACNGCTNAIVSNNHIGRGVGSPIGGSYNNGAIYLYNSPSISLDCNMITQSDMDEGLLPKGIGFWGGSAHNVDISNNYINDSIVYGTSALENAKGPIVILNESGQPTGTFIFTNNYCDQASSDCVDGAGNSYDCCSDPGNEANYVIWKNLCGEVGAYDVDYSI